MARQPRQAALSHSHFIAGVGMAIWKWVMRTWQGDAGRKSGRRGAMGVDNEMKRAAAFQRETKGGRGTGEWGGTEEQTGWKEAPLEQSLRPLWTGTTGHLTRWREGVSGWAVGRW